MNTFGICKILAAIFGIYPKVCSYSNASTASELASILPFTTHSTEAEEIIHYANTSGRMNLNLGSADAQYDLGFIDAMSIHYLSAIEMAITQIIQWRQAWYPNLNNNSTAFLQSSCFYS